MLSSLALLVGAASLASAQQCIPTANAVNYTLREVGARNTLEWRMWLERNNTPISFWHDVPTWPNASNHRIVNFVVEIPRWTDGKIEINRAEPLNPIYHDSKNKKPRFVESVFPHKSYPFLYGSIPQTWESPNFNYSFSGAPGDNDPVDLFDIGQDVGFTGQIKQVKVLGGLSLNDGETTDWKILGIDIKDPIAPLVNSYEDLEKYRPGLLEAYRDWFTYYKVARGDGILEIVGKSYQNASFIQTVLEDANKNWGQLIRGEVDSNEISYNQTASPDVKKSYVPAADTVQKFKIPQASTAPAAKKPTTYDQWYYLSWDYQLVKQPETKC